MINFAFGRRIVQLLWIRVHERTLLQSAALRSIMVWRRSRDFTLLVARFREISAVRARRAESFGGLMPIVT